MFGGFFSNNNAERGDVIFDDLAPANFVHFVEWRTVAPVTIRSFNLFAAGDNPTQQWREFATFTLKAKSVGSPTST